MPELYDSISLLMPIWSCFIFNIHSKSYIALPSNRLLNLSSSSAGTWERWVLLAKYFPLSDKNLYERLDGYNEIPVKR